MPAPRTANDRLAPKHSRPPRPASLAAARRAIPAIAIDLDLSREMDRPGEDEIALVLHHLAAEIAQIMTADA